MTRSGTAERKLTPKQQKLLAALIEEPSTVGEAAKRANIAHTTAYRIAKDPVFKDALKEATEQLTREMQRQILSIKNQAIREHHAIINDKDVSAGVRIRAIALLYDTITKFATLYARDNDQEPTEGDDWITARAGNGDDDQEQGEQEDSDDTPDD